MSSVFAFRSPTRFCFLGVCLTASLLFSALIFTPSHQHTTVTELGSKTIGNELHGECAADIDFDAWLKASPPSAEYDLIQAHIVFRHGNRAPTDDNYCWNAAYYSQFGTAAGQMLADGIALEKAIGRGIRERYVKSMHHNSFGILPHELNDDTVDDIQRMVHLSSLVNDRTQQSAMAFFSGMFPQPTSDASVAIAFPLHVFAENTEDMCSLCSEAQPLTEALLQTAQFQYLFDGVDSSKWLPLVHNWTPTSKLGCLPSSLLNSAFDCVNVAICEKWPVPTQLTIDQKDFDSLSLAMAESINMWLSFPSWQKATRIHSGPLLRLLKERMEDKLASARGMDDASDRVFLYCGHDFRPISVSQMLGFFRYKLDKMMPYASMASIEVFKQKSSGALFVLTSFNGKVITLQKPCDAKNYGMCSFEAFEEYWADVIPEPGECEDLK